MIYFHLNYHCFAFQWIHLACFVLRLLHTDLETTNSDSLLLMI